MVEKGNALLRWLSRAEERDRRRKEREALVATSNAYFDYLANMHREADIRVVWQCNPRAFSDGGGI